MKRQTPFHIQSPRSMTELLDLYQKNPNSYIIAGGTNIMNHFLENNPEHVSLISLHEIDELKKVNRTDRYAEAGCCVTLNTMIDSPQIFHDDLLQQTLKQIGSYPIRNMATLGGNLCVKEKRMDLFPVLILLDSRIELRSMHPKRKGRPSYKSRWIHASALLSQKGELVIASHEIMSRIRIPYFEGNFHFRRKVNIRDNKYFTVNCLASLEKDILSDIRIAFSNGGRNILRNREMESNLMGRRFPLIPKDLEQVLGTLENFYPSGDDPYEAYLTQRLFKELLESLSDPKIRLY